MKGKSALVWLGLAGVAGAVLFQTSYTVQNREEQLATLNRKIVAEQEAIQILKAEWSYMNDPSRLETLARTHLSLRPTDARQFVASAEIIPMRPAPAPLPEIPPMAGLSPLQTQSGIVRASAPAAAPAPAAIQAVVKSAPAPAKVPAPPAHQPPAPAEPAAAKVAPKVQPAVAKPQQPAPQTLTPPKNLVPAKQPPAPPKTDSLGVMIARLGGNR
ncbi:cell division protein FtsL [Azospirillum sp.]|uniref:cell division protein FtsL n=1 Tax=Azospirillum sp. TaxID=34012 RepID=UPI003D70E564